MTTIRLHENTYLPKIGIRPAIDGRRNGIRESLEDTTMGLAKLAAGFLSANLRHPNGNAVECVVADTCIGGVTEAAQTAQKFSRAGVGVSITVSRCIVSPPCTENLPWGGIASQPATTGCPMDRHDSAWVLRGKAVLIRNRRESRFGREKV